jgi:hypothetical protein
MASFLIGLQGISGCVATAGVPSDALIRRTRLKELKAMPVALSLTAMPHSSRHELRPRAGSTAYDSEARIDSLISRARMAIVAAGHGHRTGRTRHAEQYASVSHACSRRIFPGPSSCLATNAIATAIGSSPSGKGYGGAGREWAFEMWRGVPRGRRCIGHHFPMSMSDSHSMTPVSGSTWAESTSLPVSSGVQISHQQRRSAEARPLRSAFRRRAVT